jgi:hypothetical protein
VLWRRGGWRGGALRAVWGRILGRGGYSVVSMEMLGGRGRGVERTCFDMRAMQDIRGGWDMVRSVVDGQVSNWNNSRGSAAIYSNSTC